MFITKHYAVFILTWRKILTSDQLNLWGTRQLYSAVQRLIMIRIFRMVLFTYPTSITVFQTGSFLQPEFFWWTLRFWMPWGNVQISHDDFLSNFGPPYPHDGILTFSINSLPNDVFNQPLSQHIPKIEQEELWIKLFQPL